MAATGPFTIASGTLRMRWTWSPSDRSAVAWIAVGTAYGAEDPQADFWESYFSERTLRLPAGPWRLTAIADFSIGDGCVGRGVRLEASIVIEVTD